MENDSMILVYRLTLPGRLLNVSSRAQAGTGALAHIVGFVVDGPRPKTLLIRGAGPSLTALGVTGALVDPTLTVFNNASASVAANDNWGDAAAADIRTAIAATGAFAFETGSRDAALLVTLDPGAYTAHVSAPGGATGVSLVEIYEVP